MASTGSWEWAAWLDSYEGLPPPQPRAKPLGRGHSWLEKAALVAPGLMLAGVLAFSAIYVAEWLGHNVLAFDKSPIAPIPVAVLAGAALRTFIGLPREYEAGLRMCLRFILRIGIVLLGLRLSLAAVGTIGVDALPIVVICISAAIIVASLLSRALRMTPSQGYLIAAGTGICGVSAIVAVTPVVRAKDDEVSYSIACITVFGMAAMLCYPPLAYWLFHGDARTAGYFLGTSIHDTAQVAGAALIYRNHFNAPEALDVATVTKLVRNTMMVVVIPLLGFLTRRNQTGLEKGTFHWSQAVPFFVIAYLGLAAIRTIGDLGAKPFLLLDMATWKTALHGSDIVSAALLTTAMAAVGLGTDFRRIRTLGFRPMIVGLSAALVVGGVSWAILTVAHPR